MTEETDWTVGARVRVLFKYTNMANDYEMTELQGMTGEVVEVLEDSMDNRGGRDRRGHKRGTVRVRFDHTAPTRGNVAPMTEYWFEPFDLIAEK